MMSKLYLPYNNLYGCITLVQQVAKRQTDARTCQNVCIHGSSGHNRGSVQDEGGLGVPGDLQSGIDCV